MTNSFLKLASCLCGLSLMATSVTSAQNLTDELVTKIAAPLVENKVVDGLSIGYLEGDHYGFVHLGSSNRAGKPANNLTVYELGSISKVFTSLLLADAVVRGELELDATANVENAAGISLPSREARSIQWLDLSTHRSGLPRLPANFLVTSTKNPYRLYDSKKAASALASFKLDRTPGESQEYSNFGASVLGYLIAENAKSSYQDLLREQIAEPLGMNDCTIDLTNDQKKRFATPHDKVGSTTLAWSFADLPGAGGVRSTMFDMMRFAKAQLNPPPGRLGEAIELAWKQHSAADASGSATGLGWMIHGDGETRWHNGGTGGTRTAIFINRRINSAVIVLCNTAVANEVDALAVQLLQVAAGIPANAEPANAEPANAGPDNGPPKVSPFTSVGISGENLFVAFKGTVYHWREVNGIKVEDIVSSAKKRYGEKWGKRVREDLAEVLWDMGHKPGATVKLRLQNFKTKKELVVEDAPMTKANRDAIRAESNAGKANEKASPGKGNVTVDAKIRARLVGQYKLASFIFDVEDRDGQMMVRISGQEFNEVFPDSPTKWSYRGIDAMIEFKLGKSGPARQLTLHQNGIKQVARRMGK